MIMVMVSGMPSALVVLEPKLDVMSLRTMPLSVSTFAPLEPSPGYGPAVSSGSSPLAVSLVSPLSGGAPPPGGDRPDRHSVHRLSLGSPQYSRCRPRTRRG